MFLSTTDIAKPTSRTENKQVGIVVNNKDPKKLGAVQVRIPGFIDGDDAVLPWASAIQPPGLGGTGNSRNVSVPNIGSQVILTVIDQYTMYYQGFLPTEKISNSGLEEDYPNTYGYTDEQGTGWKVNRKSQVVTITHSSGTVVTLTKEGDVKIVAARDFIVNARNINLTASAEFNANSKTYKNNSQDFTISSSSSGNIKSSGPLTIKGSPLSMN